MKLFTANSTRQAAHHIATAAEHHTRCSSSTPLKVTLDVFGQWMGRFGRAAERSCHRTAGKLRRQEFSTPCGLVPDGQYIVVHRRVTATRLVSAVQCSVVAPWSPSALTAIAVVWSGFCCGSLVSCLSQTSSALLCCRCTAHVAVQLV